MHGGSYKLFKEEIRKYLIEHYPPKSLVLDVGAGSGTYALLLGDYFELDAIEVFKPSADYIEGRYRKVYNKNIKDYEYEYYDVVMFGDVIEHLEVEEAQKVLEYALQRSKEVIVAVPYQYPQGEVDGNVYEIHKQDDLTPELMKERYPYLHLLYGNDVYGYYTTL
jgi:SAM-dependent methyltransferase